jgi:hypothetical protein
MSIRMSSRHPIDGSLSPVRGAVIGNPKYSFSRTIWFLCHHKADKLMKRFNAGLLCADPKDFSTMNIPACNISLSSVPYILGFDLPIATRPRGTGLGYSFPGLDGGLFVCRDYMIIRTKELSLPDAMIEIKDFGCLFGKIRITWKYPASITSRLNSIGAQPAPDRGSTDRGGNTSVHCFLSDIRMTQPGKGKVSDSGQFTGQGLDLHDHLRGKNGPVSRALEDRRVH